MSVHGIHFRVSFVSEDHGLLAANDLFSKFQQNIFSHSYGISIENLIKLLY